MERRQQDKEHENCSRCPLTPKQVTQMLGDIRDMKRYFLMGRVVAWTIGTIAVCVLWLFDRAGDIRDGLNHFIDDGK